jgi:peptide/nickel transport system permease protein
VTLRYLLRRLALTLPTLVGAVTFVFIMVRLAPGTVVDTLLGDLRATAPKELIEGLIRQYGLDEPLLRQYTKFVVHLVQGDLGLSLLQREPVWRVLAPHVGPTLTLALGSLLVALVVGVPAGLMAALHRGTPVDTAATTLAVGAISGPSFWLAIVAIYVLGYRVPLFPMFGRGTTGNPWSVLWHVALPASVLGLRSAASLTRLARSAVLDVLGQDYIRTAQAKGLHERRIRYRHVLTNAAISIITIVSTDVAYLVGGTVVVETVFARPGLGKTLVDAILARDYPVVQGCVLVFAGGVIFVNLVADMLIGILDPRVRYE